MKKTMLFVILLVLVISQVHALEISVIPVEDRVYPGENLFFKLVLNNTGTETLRVNALTYEGSLSPRPSYYIEPGEVREINFDIPVPKDTFPMRNVYPVMFKDNLDREWRVEVTGFILYKATEITIEGVEFEKDHLPTEPLIVRTRINNLKTIKTVEFALRVHDAHGNIISRNETTLTLQEDEEITFPLSLDISHKTPPGSYEITAAVLLYAIPSERYYVNILPFEDYDISRCFEESFFGKKGEIVLENRGNVVLKNREISTPLQPLNRIFLVSKPRDAEYIGGNLVLSGDIEPGKKMVLYYSVSYLPLILIPIILALICVYLFMSMIKIIVKKEVLDYSHTDEEVNIKVVVKVKNTFNKTVKDLEVLDPLPAFAKNIKEFGTLEGKIEQRGYNKYVKWVIEELKPREEVVLSYHISTKVGVMGKFTLFPSIVEFVHLKKMYKIKSNKLEMNIE